MVRCQPDRLLQRRLTGLDPGGKTLTEHAHRAEFRCFGKFVTATRAAASGLRFHGPNRPSTAISASHKARISPSISAGFVIVRATSSLSSVTACWSILTD